MLENGSKKGFLLVKIDFVFLPTTFIVYRFLVHCRVGSLEKHASKRCRCWRVHCRVGSLEICHFHQNKNGWVHCRVGSLENQQLPVNTMQPVHCRVGSLENVR